jgi:hypothetical protein
VAAPPALEADYRAEVRAWMPEHPFVGATPREFASPVFEDYVHARTLREGAESAKAAIGAKTADASYRPTEMLVRLFAELVDGASVSGDDFTVLYESVLAAEDAGQMVSLSLVAVDTQGQHLGFIRIGDRPLLTLEIAAQDAPLRFVTRLSRSHVLTDNDVHLGAYGRLFEVGPDVVVMASTVSILGESIGVRAPQKPVLIAAKRLVGVDHTLRFAYGGDQFSVTTDEPVRYPFADKVVSVTIQGGPLSSGEAEVARALFRLAGMFKTEGYEGLGSYAEPIDRVAARNEIFQRVLAKALDKGIIDQDGGIYKFHPEHLSLDYSAVQAQALSSDARVFVREVIRSRPA